jgi:UDP-4-amino-4,6-dideoxy-N-acetyl-beta-L-altrosamine transaminase
VGLVSTPPQKTPLPYGRQWIDDDDVAATIAQLRDPFLTQGPMVAAFEQALCEATGAPYAVAVSSGTAALHLACLAAGMKAGSYGLVPDITFVATANAVRYCGGTPVLVDVDPNTGLVSMPALKDAVAKLAQQGHKISTLMPVSFSGAVADLPAIEALAKSTGALVIEDAAHSLGARYEVKGESFRSGSCAHSDMAILSFHPVKHVTTAEGGAITTRDKGLYQALCDLRTHGITKDPARLSRNDGPWYYEQQSLGYNYRITDLQCALGVSQLKRLERFVDRRREIAARYDAALATPELAAGYQALQVRDGVRSSYHLYVVRLRARSGETGAQVASRRLALFMKLREAQIFAQVHYIPVHQQPDFMAAGLSGASYPGADAYYASCISLPMFPAMADSDVDRVLEVLRS